MIDDGQRGFGLRHPILLELAALAHLREGEIAHIRMEQRANWQWRVDGWATALSLTARLQPQSREAARPQFESPLHPQGCFLPSLAHGPATRGLG